jgi:hypothetical protein
VISWDPVGQGERSQFWDPAAGKSRYNLICGEHAVMGNLAYLAGANLARWEIWDGIRAVDYLLTRPEVDGERISITGTSGGGFQAALIAALDERIKVAVPSCYISALPMRISNRIFADPDSDPEQDLFGMISSGLDHPGLLPRCSTFSPLKARAKRSAKCEGCTSVSIAETELPLSKAITRINSPRRTRKLRSTFSTISIRCPLGTAFPR